MFTSAISLLMLKTKIYDDVLDKNTIFSRLAARLIKKKILLAEQELDKLGYDSRIVYSQIKRQINLEDESNTNLEMLATPTEEVVSSIFEHTAVLSDVKQNINPLSAIGKSVGKLMFILDNYIDLPEDNRKKM